MCWTRPPSRWQRWLVVRFFQAYAIAKGVLNLARGQRGRMGCTGWGSAEAALARSAALGEDWQGPLTRF